MTFYRGRVEHGVVVLEGGVRLPEGSTVRVEPEEEPPAHGDAVYRLHDFAGPTGVPDLAGNIDHYLYGHPRMSEQDE